VFNIDFLMMYFDSSDGSIESSALAIF
jgi:hypothetical protein